MQAKLGIIALLGMLVLAACGEREPRLYNLTTDTGGPDEFAILPTKPLEIPEDLASLPQPEPGGTNRTDPTPEADAFAALGGNAEVLTRGSTDGGLVNYATRYGVNRNIRAELAAADEEYRRENDGRLLERLFAVSVYFKAYRPFELDQHRELERFRAAGIPTPAAPPEESVLAE
jgi:hypothetical protein